MYQPTLVRLLTYRKYVTIYTVHSQKFKYFVNMYMLDKDKDPEEDMSVPLSEKTPHDD
jgi:hypothetical protein